MHSGVRRSLPRLLHLQPVSHRAAHAPATASRTRLSAMSTLSTKTDHSQRTEHEPRDDSLHRVILQGVQDVNETIRTITLRTTTPVIRFLPGQWLDVYVPGIPRPGGFSITSPPSAARADPEDNPENHPEAAEHKMRPAPALAEVTRPWGGRLELAIKKSPDNAVANWFWQPERVITGTEITIRVGGSFVWPPPGLNPTTLRKVVFVAGGVGINPLMSILSHLAEETQLKPRLAMHFLYSLRDPGHQPGYRSKMLYLNSLMKIFSSTFVRFGRPPDFQGELRLFLTGGEKDKEMEHKEQDKKEDDSLLWELDCTGIDPSKEDEKWDSFPNERRLPFQRRRITVEDVAKAVGKDQRKTVVYVCGVPKMTDEFVKELTSSKGLGLEPHRVLYEKWW